MYSCNKSCWNSECPSFHKVEYSIYLRFLLKFEVHFYIVKFFIHGAILLEFQFNIFVEWLHTKTWQKESGFYFRHLQFCPRPWIFLFTALIITEERLQKSVFQNVQILKSLCDLENRQNWIRLPPITVYLQSVYQPGKPMEFYDTHGKPGNPMEFVNCTWNFRINTFLLIHMQNLSIHT